MREINMARQREYRELFDLNPVLLLKNDLFELEKILVEDPETDQIDIELSFDNTSIPAESFDDLLANTDLPVSTDNLSINMRRWTETEGGVSLSLNYNHISCHIHSFNQTWLLGKKSQIEKFFSSKRPWYSFLKKSSVAFPAIAFALLLYSSVLLGKKQYYEMILPIACSIVLIIISVLTVKEKLFPFVKVYLQERTSIKFGFSEWCALIGALSGLATLVQVLSMLFR
jgi:hypothetical protein